MQIDSIEQQLKMIVESNIEAENYNWLEGKINTIIANKSTKDLFMTYSLIASKIKLKNDLNTAMVSNDLGRYLEVQKANLRELSRLYLLTKVTNADIEFFTPKVANIIQVADTGELATFLKFLIVLPQCEKYKSVAVDTLRTNIATVFDAIALNNPYPGKYFDDNQWNQMYLKAAFMPRDLSKIWDVDKRANSELARIISDYAHERWAASREVNPYFWRPVGSFLNDILLKDMERLFLSSDLIENKAAALCCHRSKNPKAKSLLNSHLELKEQIENNSLSWETLKD
ncbi:EboA domain-containing protein [uncultured Kriegella sp.]|uniref:EboA domain-containing protein n=1 Tax=uncultured Kriegella sp. TaxID=1798910 RepID=UPI0030D73639|tara:strand:+ start:137785 stop:138642 length:858 start_codon:yes stop_codon:yes gene_type:complete